MLLQPVPEQNLAHYRDRLLLSENNYTWLQRAHDHITSEIGVENGDNPGSHTGFGGLKFRRVSPGDPVSGFDDEGLPVFAMNVLPMTIEATYRTSTRAIAKSEKHNLACPVDNLVI